MPAAAGVPRQGGSSRRLATATAIAPAVAGLLLKPGWLAAEALRTGVTALGDTAAFRPLELTDGLGESGLEELAGAAAAGPAGFPFLPRTGPGAAPAAGLVGSGSPLAELKRNVVT